ncbi:glycosyltransferase family 2 protein [Flavobacterium sp. 7A]|uniref:glycosyltransferase family 2 protein n=1 Tax=Flavobacterium sp. 7A TaxID=2940571 RepID=UPI00222791BF|nr:glycosyltransferase family 2 protein [Flavobacterium sp. 7A]MCW2119457.1 glycosyltransferase involved in cell wall biosynthesis [Flavobacterium sp. 7A]
MNTTIQISFLITHFNRPDDLKKCLQHIHALGLPSYEIVVSDDCSTIKNQEVIKTMEIDKLLIAPENQGLAANINKGIDACRGEYIIYCQEDFILKAELKEILPQCVDMIKSNTVDMIRFYSNVKFSKLIKISNKIHLIPKFSLQNLHTNYYQYSDHPFIIRKDFFILFGYYLENTSGDYGETEYAIRMMRSKSKIGLLIDNVTSNILGSNSVIDRVQTTKNNRFNGQKQIRRFARTLRLYFECLLYDKRKRGLRTYTNFRKLK